MTFQLWISITVLGPKSSLNKNVSSERASSGKAGKAGCGLPWEASTGDTGGLGAGGG